MSAACATLFLASFLAISLAGCGGGGGSSIAPTPPPPPPPVSNSPYLRPLTGNLGAHDPTVIAAGGVWYEFQTGPGIFRKISSDGLDWQPLPSVLPQALPWWHTYVPNQSGTDVWAPDVAEFGGRVWIYYSISSFGSKVSAIGLISASSLAADDWRDDGLVTNTTDANDYNAIDPNLTLDAAGDPWLTFGSFNSGIKLMQIDPATMKPTGGLFAIASRAGGIEAPVIVYRAGFYHLFVSVGICCQGVNSTYRIFYGRAVNITGPYLDEAGADLMQGGGSLLEDGDARWKGPGGQDLIGTDLIAFHAYDAADAGNPKLLMAPVTWNADGWPRLQ